MKYFLREALEKSIEKSLNYLLQFDLHAQKKLTHLVNKKISLELLGIGLNLTILFLPNKMIILKEKDLKADIKADTVIQGAPFSLLQIVLSKENRKNLFNNGVTIEGDLELGQAVMELIDELEIDWQELFAKWVGDAPVYHANNVITKVKNLRQRANKSLLRNLDEYLHEEINAFPQRERLNYFFQEVDVLRTDIDRLEARIQYLNHYLLKQA